MLRHLGRIVWLLAAGSVMSAPLLVSADAFFNSGGNKRFHVGDGVTADQGIYFSCHAFDIFSANAAGGARFTIPSNLGITFNTGDTTISKVDPGPTTNTPASDISTTVAYFDGGRTMRVALASAPNSFTHGDDWNIGGFQFNIPVSANPGTTGTIEMYTGSIVPGAFDHLDTFNIRIADLPQAASTSSQTLSPGAVGVACGAITVQESAIAGNGGIWATSGGTFDFGIRITIPASVSGVTWNAGSFVTCSGNAVTNGRISATPVVTFTENGGRTARITVAGDFGQNEQVTISGLEFNLSALAPDTTFQLGIRTGPQSNATVHRTCSGVKTIVGEPTISSAQNRFYTVGDPASPAPNIVITENPGSPKLNTANDIIVRIPNTIGMTFNTAVIPSAVASGAGSGAVGVPSFNDNRNLFIPVTTNFTANRIVTISGLQYANFTTASSGSLQLICDPLKADPDSVDDKTLGVGHPTISSAAAEQVFLISPPGPASVPISTITLRDDLTNARITNGAQIRIRIPAGFNMNWDTADLTASVTGKLSPTVSYPDSKTLLLTANASFAAGETATISGLSFVGFTATSAPNNLQLFMSATGTVTDLDDKIIAIGGIPGITSGTNQQFTLNDPSTPANNIVITDSASPSLQSGQTMQIIIPGGLNMTWNTAIVPSATPGAGTGTVGAPSFANNRTLNIPITADFAGNQTLTISGAHFTNFLGASGPLGLQISVTAGGPVAATDNRTKAIGAPSISSAAAQVFGVGDPATAAQTIVITEDATTPRILAGATALRIRIPAGFNMRWDPTATMVATPGAGTGTVGTPTVLGGNTVLQIQVLTPFSAGQTLQITGARFNNFTGTSATDNLELEVNTSGVANNFDTQTIRIGTRPTVTSIQTGDTNGNGSIDQLVVTFNEPMNPAPSSVTTGLGFTLPGYTFALGSAAGSVVTFTLNETGTADTGATPALTYDPAVGNLADVNDGLEPLPSVSPFPATLDRAAPVIVGFSTTDADNNGALDSITFAFSEALAPGQADINDWRLIDADGTTNLLNGVTTGNVSILGSTVTIALTNSLGTVGIPRFRYQSDGVNGRLQDLAASPNFVPVQSNNSRPVASAGINQSVGPDLVHLNGTASFDPDGQPLTFTWSQVANGAPLVTLNGPLTSTPNFLVTANADYVFQLVVGDGLDTTTTTTTVTVVNVPPSPVVLFDQVVDAGASVNLDARFSSDANGNALTFSWTQIANPPTPTVTINNALTNLANFTPPVSGIYKFQVAVIDGVNTSFGFLTIVVNGANGIPRANAGPDQLRPVGSVVKLDGGLSADPDGNPMTYAWTPAGLLSNPASQSPTFVPPLPGIYTFQLIVTDSLGVESLPSTCKILVFDPANRPPTAVGNKLSPAGNPVIGDLVTLDGTGSVDPEGAPLQFSWSQISGPFTVLKNPATANPTFTPVVTGDFTFQLVVSDGVQQSFPVQVFVQVRPTPGYAMPTVAAQIALASDPDQDGRVTTSPVQLQVTAAGVSSFPAQGFWTQVGGTPVSLSNPFSGTPTFTPLVAGVFRFNVVVIEATGLTAQQRVEVVFDNATNSVPTANAGVDLAANAGDLVTLDGTASSDSAGDIDAVLDFNTGLRPYWQQIAGPAVPLSDPFTARPTLTPTLAGSYVFALVVSDGKAASATDTVTVTVTGSVSSGPVAGGGGGDGGCGLGPEALVVVGLLALLRRRARR